MPIPDKIAALFAALTPADLDAMPPAQRRRFADTCRHWANKADKKEPAKAGVLADLGDGRGRQ